MPTQKKDALFDLITSLTKAEKRNFRIYAKKIQSSGEVLFLQLFDYLEKQNVYNANKLLSETTKIRKSQLANLKRNLYQHILTSLRLLYSQKQVSLQIREFLDYSEVLYNKGLYLQALKILSRAKKIAQKNHQSLLHAEIVAFESKIESRHITRSSTERMSELMQESKEGNQVISNVSELANLKLYLQRIFINNGHIKEDALQQKIEQYFQQNTAGFTPENATFFEKVFYFQSCYWYHFLLQNYAHCHYFATQWLALYKLEDNMIIADIDLYLRAVHHQLNTTFFIKDATQLRKTIEQLSVFIKANSSKFSLNAYVQAHLFLYQAQFNQFFLKDQFEEGLTIIPKVLSFIQDYEYQLDNYKIMILYYKIAICFFGVNQPSKTIDYINLIINQSREALREDILRFSRLLGVLAYYELNNFPALEYTLNIIERQLNNLIQPDRLSSSTVTFFKKLIVALPQTEQQLFHSFHKELQALVAIPTEGRAFIFLDMLKWAEQKI